MSGTDPEDTDREDTDHADRLDENRERTDEADATVSENDEGTADERSEYATEADVRALREDVAAFAEDIEERTVERPALKEELERYVRQRQRRGHARGWGPYLVLLYGTVMTVAAFFSPFLGGGWAILAMLVIWLSVLGLYVLFVLVGLIGGALGLPGRLRDRIGEFRS